MNILYMLIGIPGSGKSTWIGGNINTNDTVIVSSDDYIEQYAQQHNKTYNQVYKEQIKNAVQNINKRLDYAIKNNMNIVWDQTNTSSKTRREKLSKIPNSYKKIAVYFETPNNIELNRRLNNRPNKTISSTVISHMKNSLQLPTVEEGFDEIIIIKQ